MVWVVVQWVGENSVSVINEKEINEEADLIKEGATVSVISKNSKGKAQLYRAVVQKVFATKSKALDHEKTLIKPLDSSDEQQTLKRPRKPSRKVADVQQDDSEDEGTLASANNKKQEFDDWK